LDVVKYLLEWCFANSNAKNNAGQTALDLASEYSSSETKRYLEDKRNWLTLALVVDQGGKERKDGSFVAKQEKKKPKKKEVALRSLQKKKKPKEIVSAYDNLDMLTKRSDVSWYRKCLTFSSKKLCTHISDDVSSNLGTTCNRTKTTQISDDTGSCDANVNVVAKTSDPPGRRYEGEWNDRQWHGPDTQVH
jgi:hypothetical protein